MRLPLLPVAAVAAALASAVPARAQAPAADRDAFVRSLREALVRDPSILRDALAALQADDVRRQEQVTRNVISMLAPRLADPADPVAGNPLGDVTVIEFYDTRCPYCRQMKPILAELLRSDPNVRLVVKDLPVLGPASQLESRALLAAQKQGGYFKLQDPVVQSGGTPTRDTLRDMATRAGLDGNRLLRDIDDPAIKERLTTNVDLARQIGIEGTPAMVIGTKLIAGAVTLAELQKAVAAARVR